VEASDRHPVRLILTDDRQRSRLLAFFRLPLAFPHLVWLTLWTLPALLAGLVNWFATLVVGRSPSRLHKFLAAYCRYFAHVNAFLLLVANPFPGFVGAAGSYQVDLDIDPPVGQRRWKTFVRLVLLLPTIYLFALIVVVFSRILYFILFICATVSSLVLGRVPEGVRNLAAFVIRYEVQELAYVLAVTSRYPYTGPFYGNPPYV
jgi:Domain of unknown function (DUF4389)